MDDFDLLLAVWLPLLRLVTLGAVTDTDIPPVLKDALLELEAHLYEDPACKLVLDTTYAAIEA